MANYCPNCGASVNSGASFCSNCGAALNGGSYSGESTASANNNSANTGNILGTLVAVSLLGGLTRQLYYYNGRYFLDPYCRRPFGSPHMIVGRHRPMGMRPMMPPHAGPHGPMSPHGGGFHGGPHGGGFHGGGPRGGRR